MFELLVLLFIIKLYALNNNTLAFLFTNTTHKLSYATSLAVGLR